NPNLHSLFADPNLEIAIRYTLKIPTDELTDNNLLSVDSLQPVAGLEDITLLDGLEHCKNLVYLEMGLQNITDISALETLTKLKRVGLDQNRKIENITPLANLTDLEWLNLDSNLIEDISPLKNLTKLIYLNLQYNSITDISVLKNIKNLRELWMSQASINDLFYISHMNKLEHLWLNKCGINNIINITNLTNIKVLKLAWNNIDDISSLRNLEKLEWLALEMNKITEISSLKKLYNLRYVRLWDNQISDIKPLVDNPAINKGDIVGLNGNPLNEKSINEYIPILQSRGVYVSW
ncbi:leucine-rich repeat domain-containing protein, partial [candidate division KSB1 bacterium]|nr:leucine-rich repeat domain-containing protein [candidate division KSB1 bacterium]